MRGFPYHGGTLLSASLPGLIVLMRMRHMDTWTDVSLEWPDIDGPDFANFLKRISSMMETWTISMSAADLSGMRQAYRSDIDPHTPLCPHRRGGGGFWCDKHCRKEVSLIFFFHERASVPGFHFPTEIYEVAATQCCTATSS